MANDQQGAGSKLEQMAARREARNQEQTALKRAPKKSLGAIAIRFTDRDKEMLRDGAEKLGAIAGKHISDAKTIRTALALLLKAKENDAYEALRDISV
jgi:hypothetical protein